MQLFLNSLGKVTGKLVILTLNEIKKSLKRDQTQTLTCRKAQEDYGVKSQARKKDSANMFT